MHWIILKNKTMMVFDKLHNFQKIPPQVHSEPAAVKSLCFRKNDGCLEKVAVDFYFKPSLLQFAEIFGN